MQKDNVNEDSNLISAVNIEADDMPAGRPKRTCGIPLYTFDLIPSYLQFNPFIRSGYRWGLSFKLCTLSLFTLHNETINIWSHLIGIIYLLVYTPIDYVYLNSLDASYPHYLIFVSFIVLAMLSLTLSALYHLLMCHSEYQCDMWLRMDSAGIGLALCGCYIPSCFYAFYCPGVENTWRDVYMVALCLAVFISLILPLHPDFLTRRWNIRRLLFYFGLIMVGGVPITQWVVMQGGFGVHIVFIFLIPNGIIMYVLGLAGGAFYVTKFPERIWPGKFDYFGASHQLWHVCVLLALTWMHHIVRTEFYYRITTESCS
ncbi:Progestin and adipoQ receptor family member 3-like [Oopsacas minuta]|uniref:Progestin and adipoQ receptor family member 3-like n=1 Tax=Oopsacas minuta TaxID=111878 RepID=A0AAV7K6W6_9METZ|nr:Progestin and adipoQ receptor family member 3-like [Oopsacas minuta]